MRLKKKNLTFTKPRLSYQSYTWGSGGLGNSCHQDTILKFLYHSFRRQIQITSTSGKGKSVLEECFNLRENGDFFESKLRLWKWLQDDTNDGHNYYCFGRSASIISIFFRLTENSDQSFTLKFRIAEKTSTVCTVQPQKHRRTRTKHDDILHEYVLADRKYKINSVLEHLLTRTYHITSGRCGNVISDTSLRDQHNGISEITSTTALFCDGKSKVTTEVINIPNFFL